MYAESAQIKIDDMTDEAGRNIAKGGENKSQPRCAATICPSSPCPASPSIVEKGGLAGILFQLG